MREIRNNKKVTLTVEESRFVEQYIDIMEKLLIEHNLDVDEYLSDVTIKLCELVNRKGLNELSNYNIKHRIHLMVHALVKSNDGEYEVIPSVCIDTIAVPDLDHIAMAIDTAYLWEHLTCIEHKIVKAYCKGYSYEEIGNLCNMSVSRVRAINARVIHRLRHPDRCRSLRNYC